ncbi:MAG: hypothetical protein ACRDAM_21835, partial [Casimicrobium sp.]
MKPFTSGKRCRALFAIMFATWTASLNAADPPADRKQETAASEPAKSSSAAHVADIPKFSSLSAAGALTGWTFQPLRGVRKTTQYTA